MADNLTTADGKELQLFPALDDDASIDGLPVLSAGSLYIASLSQLKNRLSPPMGVGPSLTLEVPATGVVGRSVSLVAVPVAVAPATVSKVEFFAGSQKIGQVTQAPWVFDYTPTAATQPGERPTVIKGVVSDSNGAQATSINYNLTVSVGSSTVNQAPVVSMRITPRNPVVGDTLAIEAVATDSDGTITRIELYDYGQLVDAVTSSPYTFQFPAVVGAVGQHYFSIKAYDNLNAPTQTPGQAVTIVAADTPALPSYNTTLNTATQVADGISFAPASTEQLKFNLISGTVGASIDIAITSLGAISYSTYASEYAGQGYAFVNSAGTRFEGTLPASDNLGLTF